MPFYSKGGKIIVIDDPTFGTMFAVGENCCCVGITIDSVDPDGGSDEGYTLLTIYGTGFIDGLAVEFGPPPRARVPVWISATEIVYIDSTEIQCRTPKHSGGKADVRVTNPDGESAVLAQGFEFAKLISSVTPNTGPEAGDTDVTIHGKYIVDGATIEFDGIAATDVVFVDDTTLTCKTPAHAAGQVNVEVINPDGSSSTLTNGYRYGAAITITSVSPNHGPHDGGTRVDIRGTGFIISTQDTPPNRTKARFRGVLATSGYQHISDTHFQCLTPPNTVGFCDVEVRNPRDGASATLPNGFAYDEYVTPANGPSAGGTPVTIFTNRAQAGAVVRFGGTLASNVIVGSGRVDCVTPAHAPGTVEVLVTNPDNSTASFPNAFTFGSPFPTQFTMAGPDPILLGVRYVFTIDIPNGYTGQVFIPVRGSFCTVYFPGGTIMCAGGAAARFDAGTFQITNGHGSFGVVVTGCARPANGGFATGYINFGIGDPNNPNGPHPTNNSGPWAGTDYFQTTID